MDNYGNEKTLCLDYWNEKTLCSDVCNWFKLLSPNWKFFMKCYWSKLFSWLENHLSVQMLQNDVEFPQLCVWGTACSQWTAGLVSAGRGDNCISIKCLFKILASLYCCVLIMLYTALLQILLSWCFYTYQVTFCLMKMLCYVHWDWYVLKRWYFWMMMRVLIMAKSIWRMLLNY